MVIIQQPAFVTIFWIRDMIFVCSRDQAFAFSIGGVRWCFKKLHKPSRAAHFQAILISNIVSHQKLEPLLILLFY